jgi:hypothetical protein
MDDCHLGYIKKKILKKHTMALPFYIKKYLIKAKEEV